MRWYKGKQKDISSVPYTFTDQMFYSPSANYRYQTGCYSEKVKLLNGTTLSHIKPIFSSYTN